MLTIFNRKELIVVLSQRQFFGIREALDTAGIAYHVNMRGASRDRDGTFGLQQDALDTYTIYVHRDDYERARAAIQPALRE